MKKSLMMIITLLWIASAAQAAPLTVNVGGADVTLYGTIDAGVWLQSKSTSTAAGGPVVGPVNAGSVNRFHSGGIAPSKWGLRGSKDLGNGLTAIFTLEEHITAGTGAIDAFGYPGFARQAFIGFKGNFGTVLIGEQFNPALVHYAYTGTDPREGRESLSGLQPWILTTNFANPTGSASLDAFAHNAISYSVNISKVSLAALYAMGGSAGDSSGNSQWSLGATYAGTPVIVSGGYQVGNGSDGDKAIVKASIGAAWKHGPFALKVNHLNAKQYNPAGAKSANYKITGIGVDWKPTSKQTFNVSYYDGKNDVGSNNRAGTWVLGAEYVYVPGTTFYLQFAWINAKAQADLAVSLLGNTSLVQGAKTSVLNAGVSFNF